MNRSGGKEEGDPVRREGGEVRRSRLGKERTSGSCGTGGLAGLGLGGLGFGRLEGIPEVELDSRWTRLGGCYARKNGGPLRVDGRDLISAVDGRFQSVDEGLLQKVEVGSVRGRCLPLVCKHCTDERCEKWDTTQTYEELDIDELEMGE